MTATEQENEKMYKDLYFRMVCLENEVAGWKKKFEMESIRRQVVEQWIGEEFGFDVSDEVLNLERIPRKMSKTWKRTISNIKLAEAEEGNNTNNNSEKNDPAAVLSGNGDGKHNKISLISNRNNAKNPVAFDIFNFNNNHTSSAHFRTANREASARKVKNPNSLPAKFSLTKRDDFNMTNDKHDFNSAPTSAKPSDAQRIIRYSAAAATATAIPLHFSSQPAEPNVAARNTLLTFGNSSSMEAALKPNSNSVKSEREEMDPLQIFGNSALQLTLVDPIRHTMAKTYLTPSSYHIQQNSAFEDVDKLNIINNEGAQSESATMLTMPIKLQLTHAGIGMEKGQSSKKLNFTNSEAIIMDTEMVKAKVNTTTVRARASRKNNNFRQCMECIKIRIVFRCPNFESLRNHLKIVHGARIMMGEHKSTTAKARNELRRQCLKESAATAKGKHSYKKDTRTHLMTPSMEPSLLLKSSQLFDYNYNSPRVICKGILNKSVPPAQPEENTSGVKTKTRGRQFFSGISKFSNQEKRNGANAGTGTGKGIPRSADPDGKTVVAESESVASEKDFLLEVCLPDVVNIQTVPNTRYPHTGNTNQPHLSDGDGLEGAVDKSPNSRRRKQILVPIIFPYDNVEEDFKI